MGLPAAAGLHTSFIGWELGSRSHFCFWSTSHGREPEFSFTERVAVIWNEPPEKTAGGGGC